jgi:hypothetical protein
LTDCLPLVYTDLVSRNQLPETRGLPVIVTVRVRVEVDPDKWRFAFGNEDVRSDVRDYILATLQQSAGVEEAEAQVTVR